MAIKITETFEIDAPMDQVWEFISDPTKVVTCLPGAELTQVIDAKTYEGKVKVKVGPILAAYKGLARIEELDGLTHTIRVAAEGKETAGAGLAKAGMIGVVEATPSGGTKVSVNADVDIKGKLAQFGGGLIQEVARQIFKQFAENVQDVLSSSEGEADVTETSPAVSEPAPTAAHASAAAAPMPAHQDTPPVPSDINALALILKSIGAIFARFFGRLFGSVG